LLSYIASCAVASIRASYIASTEHDVASISAAARPSYLAWQHRAESPLIRVATSPDGSDAHAPLVTAVPRSEWETGTWAQIASHVDRADFDPDVWYHVCYETSHPGAEFW
jgi:hypothetical protein